MNGTSGLSDLEQVTVPRFGLARESEFLEHNLSAIVAEAFARSGVAHKKLGGADELLRVACGHEQSIDVVPRDVGNPANIECHGGQTARGSLKQHLPEGFFERAVHKNVGG